MMDESKTTDSNQEEFKVPSIVNINLKKKNNLCSNVFAEPETPSTKSAIVVDEGASRYKDEVSKEKSDAKKKVPFSPAELLKQSELSANVPYKEPEWGGINEDSSKYKLEVIKDGTVVSGIPLSGKSFFVFGRLPSCDHQMEHPSISRHHAVLQYRPPPKTADDQILAGVATGSSKSSVGWYLYDMDSTHGTWVNKYKVKPQVFVRLRVGYVIKFGGSTRIFVIQGPPEDCDEESELSVTEMKKLREETEMARKMKEMAQEQEEEMENNREAFSKRNEFCTWGLEDDAEEDNPDAENPFALSELTDESLYLDDPKKSIKGFFEREGLDAPEYEFMEDNTKFGFGSRQKCRLELPVDSPNGQPVYAEVPVDGKRREAMVACALEACRMLDRLGLLRQAKHESRAKRKRKNWAENDYYDSDDDTYFDRTGDIERKRVKRMKKAMPSKGDTHESLVAQLADVVEEAKELEESLSKDEEMCKKAREAAGADDEECDALEAFMKTVKLGGLSVKTKMTMKARLNELKHLRVRLESLVAISKPFEAKIAPGKSVEKKAGASSGLYGKRIQFSKLPLTKSEGLVKVEPSDEVEEEADEETERGEGNKIEANSGTSTPEKATPIPEERSIKTEIVEDAPSAPAQHKESPASAQHKESPAQHKESPVPAKAPVSSKSDISKPAKPKKEEKLQPQESDTNPKTFSSRRDLRESAALRSQEAESAWLPPEDQVGDGLTKLNKRFGY